MAVFVLPEPGSFRELTHSRHRQDFLTRRACDGKVPRNPGNSWGASHNSTGILFVSLPSF